MARAFKLEFSPDDLSVSNVACTRVDITDLLEDNTLSWSGGVEKIGEPPKAGEMSFVLDGRDFEPLNPDSPHFPNVKRRRRFFLSFLNGLTWEEEYVGYARTFQPFWPGSVLEQRVAVTCGDGDDVLANARVPGLDPPEATSYDDVALFDVPFAAFGMSDPSGAKMAALTGPDGVYGRSPIHGQAGLVVGDAGTAMLFQTQNQFARVPLSGDELLIDGNQIALEVVHEPTAIVSGNRALMVGPFSATQEPYDLVINSSGEYEFWVRNAAGATVASVIATTLPQVGTKRHVVGEWDGHVARIIVDGVVEDEVAASVTVAITNATACFVGSPNNNSAPGIYQKAAFYEHALGPERAAAHAQTAFDRGFPQQTAGERIAAAADLSLWDTSDIQTAGLEVLPRMKTGQAPREIIAEAMRAEGIRTLWGYRGNGDPFYLGWGWKGTAPYNETQAVFASPAHRSLGEVHNDGEAIYFDDEVYTQSTHSRIGGLAHTETRTVPENEEAIAEPVTELILTNDNDVAGLCGEVLSVHGEPGYVLEKLTLHGVDEEEEDLIFSLRMGDRVRFKRYVRDAAGAEVVGVDLNTHILGFEGRLGKGGIVTCTFNLARGFDAATGYWRAGVVGYSEAGSTTVAAPA